MARPVTAALATSLALFLGPAAAADEDVPSGARWAPRVWREGENATIAVSGAALDVALPVARMLAARGLPPTVIEVPVLTQVAETPLLAPDVFYAGAPELADEVIGGAWPAAMQAVEVRERTSREIMEAVLATLPARLTPSD